MPDTLDLSSSASEAGSLPEEADGILCPSSPAPGAEEARTEPPQCRSPGPPPGGRYYRHLAPGSTGSQSVTMSGAAHVPKGFRYTGGSSHTGPTLAAMSPQLTPNERWVSMNKNILQNIFENTLKNHITEVSNGASQSQERARRMSPDTPEQHINFISDISEATSDNTDTISESFTDDTNMSNDTDPCHRQRPTNTSTDPSQVLSSQDQNIPRSIWAASTTQGGAKNRDCPTQTSQTFPSHHRSRNDGSFSPPPPPLGSSAFGSYPGDRRAVVVPGDPQIYTKEFMREQSLLQVRGYVRANCYKATGSLIGNSTPPAWCSAASSGHSHGPPFGFFHAAGVGLRAADDMVIIGSRRPSVRRGSTGNQPQNPRADTLMHKRCLVSPMVNMTDEDIGKDQTPAMAKSNVGFHNKKFVVQDRVKLFKGTNLENDSTNFKNSSMDSDYFKRDSVANYSTFRSENNNKRKPRQNKIKEKQHWIGISKSAIENILDELVVSSISSEDSGSDSRSQTPDSEGNILDHADSSSTKDTSENTVCNKNDKDKTDNLENSIRCKTNKQNSSGECSDKQYSGSPSLCVKRHHVPSTSKSSDQQGHSVGESKCSGSYQALISPQTDGPSSAHTSNKTDALQSQHLPSVNSKGLSTESHGDTDDSKAGASRGQQQKDNLNSLPGKGWVLFTKPIISSMMEEAFTRENSSSPEVQEIETERRGPGPCDTDIVTVEKSPSPEPKHKDQDRTTAQVNKKNINQKDDTDAYGCTSRDHQHGQCSRGNVKGYDRATALLLGAFGIGNANQPGKSGNAQRCLKRTNLSDIGTEHCTKIMKNDSESKGIDLRISKKCNPSEGEVRSVYDGTGRLPQNLSAVHDRQTMMVNTDMNHPQTIRQRPTPGRREQVRMNSKLCTPKDVIFIDHDHKQEAPRGYGKSVTGLADPNPDNSRKVDCAINLATKVKYTHGDHPEVKITPARIHKPCDTIEVLDMTNDNIKSRTSDLSANPQQISVMVAEAIKVGSDMPPPSAKPRSSASGRRKSNAKPNKEPRHGWVVVSKDEVHTIMDSLTSQLIMDNNADETNAATEVAECVISDDGNVPDSCNHGNQTEEPQTVRKDTKHRGQSSPPQGPHASTQDKFELVSLASDDSNSSDNKTVIEACHTGPAPSPKQEIRSKDEEFRRTAIDALNAVYRHEDGLEPEQRLLADKPNTTLQDESSDTTSSQHSQASPQSLLALSDQSSSSEEEHTAITTIIREYPARQMTTDEIDIVSLDCKEHSNPASPAEPIGTSDQIAEPIGTSDQTTFIPENMSQDATVPDPKKVFKWKSSILQRVKEDQPGECSSSHGRDNSKPLTTSESKSKRRTHSSSAKKTKRGHKRR